MNRIVRVSLLFVLGVSGMAAAQPPGTVFQGDPQAVAEVKAAIQKFLAAPTWRVRLTLSSGHVQTMEHVAPDRFHTVQQGGPGGSETYFIGGEVWTRVGGVCGKMPVSMSGLNPREMMERGGGGKITVTKGGPEVVEGMPARTYLMTIVDDQGKQTQEKLFVSAATGLVRRGEFRSDQGVLTIDYFDYGAPIVINNPPC